MDVINTVDLKSSTLFWVDQDSKKVQYSKLDGSGVAKLAQLSQYGPYGITVDATRINFGKSDSPSELRCCNKTGGDVRVLYTKEWDRMNHMALIISLPPLTSRTNHCAKQSCSGICVLIPSSYRCLSFYSEAS